MKTKTDSIAELIDFIYQNGYEIKIEGQKPLQMCTRIPLNSIPISEKKIFGIFTKKHNNIQRYDG